MQLLLKPPAIDAQTSGPKAAVLARSLAAGLPVPPFVVVAADAYRTHTTRAGVPVIRADGPDPAASRAAIIGTALAFDLSAALVSAVGRLGPRVAVRSSGRAEDLPGLSFAGQYESILDVDVDGVATAVLACWASVWGERAVAYREHSSVPHDAASMAVIVQRMVTPTLGGVAFTADPVSGERRVVVESCDEGAEAIVSGRVAPERRVFECAELQDRSWAGPDASGDVVRAAASLALAAESLLEASADIEWAYDGERLWLLQARPITTVSAPRRGPEPLAPASGLTPEPTPGPTPAPVGYRPTAWSNVNTGEVLPDVVTPMTWSVVGHVATGLLDAMFGKLGIRTDRDRIVSLIGGRAYFNASMLGSAFEKMPMRGDSEITSVFGGGDAPPGYTDLPIAPEDVAQSSTLRMIAGIPLVAVYFLRHSPKRAARLSGRMREEAAAARAALGTAPDEDELWRLATRLVGGLDTMVDAVAFSAVTMLLHGQFAAAARKRFGEDGPALTNRLLAGQGGISSADAGLALAQLGRAGRVTPEVASALRSSAAWAEVRPRLEVLRPEGEEFLAGWDAFMAEHGHHGPGELELASPRWAESPDDVLAMVVGLLDIPEADDLVSAHAARGRAAAEEEARVLGSLGGLARAGFSTMLRYARLGARTRENVKSDGVRMLATARLVLLALGEALAARGVLDAAGDIFFVTWSELPAVRAGELDARPLVADRRAVDERNRAITPPPVVLGEWDGAPYAPDGAAEGDDDVLTGLGVAAGVARGRARVIRSLRAGERVLPGEVLVAPVTDPGWTPYFIPAAAIVVDMGGMLSHGSIIAREYGIPAVVNVGAATSIIATGDILEVDGSRGVVRVLERAAAPAE